jgi:hypothetical protein
MKAFDTRLKKLERNSKQGGAERKRHSDKAWLAEFAVCHKKEIGDFAATLDAGDLAAWQAAFNVFDDSFDVRALPKYADKNRFLSRLTDRQLDMWDLFCKKIRGNAARL